MNRTRSTLFCTSLLIVFLCISCSSPSQQVTPVHAPPAPAGPLAQVDLGGKVLPDKIAIAPWWQAADASPAADVILVFSFNDTAKEPTVVLGFNGIGGEYGCNYAGQFGGSGDGMAKKAMVYVSRGLIARDKDTWLLRFQGGKPDVMQQIEVLPCTDQLKQRAIFQELAVRASHIEAMKKEFTEDPWKPEGELGDAAPEFQKIGFIPYVRNWNDDVYPRSTPKPAERGAKTLQAYGTPGEFEPIQAAAYALTDLTITAKLSDLSGPGTLVSGKDVVVTPIECTAVRSGGGSSAKSWQVKPTWLRDNQPQQVQANTSRAWYITVHAPKNAKPGLYKGTFTLAAQHAVATFPVEYRVLPFTLDKADKLSRGAYISGPVDDQYIQNMRDHSLNAASTWPENFFAPKLVDGKCISDTQPVMDQYLRKLKQAGFAEMIYFGGGDPSYANPAHLPKATQTEVGSPEFAKYYGQYWLDLRRQEKENGWPTLVCCPFDEPVKSPEKRKNYEICYDIVRQVLPDMKVWCVFMNRVGSAKTIGQKAEIWSCNGAFADVQAEKKAQAAKGVEKLIYTYTVCMVNQRPGTARFNSGANPWKYDADGMYFWAYLWYTNDPFDDLDGDVADWTPAARDVDGKIYNTVAFEGWREGLDDRLYIETCLRMAKEKNRTDILAKLDELKGSIAAGAENEYSKQTSGLDDFFFKMDNPNQLDALRARVTAMILDMMQSK